MSTVLIIGAGGVGNVTAHKCAQVPEVFSDIWLASRTLEKCGRIKESVRARTGREIRTAQLDARNTADVAKLIRQTGAKLVIHVALPYENLTIMDACLEAGADYLDTANYEPPDFPTYSYSWQWPYDEPFKEKGVMGLLGSGFDPGVTNVYCAYAHKIHFDEIHYVDIVDCNAGDHGQHFATNFNSEINIREITQKGRYYEDGEWKVTEPLAVKQTFDFPGIGPREACLMYHEEMESLVHHIKGLKRMRFWMTFSENYLTHLRVLENVGMTRIDPVLYEGHPVIPLRFLTQVLPQPASLGENYEGMTCIGCIFEGVKDGKPKKLFIYNNCHHKETYEEVGSQAVSYTTGVPAMIGAKLMLTGVWRAPGVFNMEQFDPEPFMEDLNTYGLPWREKEL